MTDTVPDKEIRPRQAPPLLGLLVLLAATACSEPVAEPGTDLHQEAVTPEVRTDEAPPAIADLLVVGTPGNTLSGRVTFTTDETCKASLRVAGGSQETRIIDFVEPGTDFELPLLGIRPEETVQVTLTVTDEAGNSTNAEPIPFTTGALPEEIFPPRKVLHAEPERMVPGVTIFSSMVISFPLTDTPGLLVAIDPEGEVVWYYRDPANLLEAFNVIHNGNILLLAGLDGAQEIDWLGNVIHHWPHELFGIQGLHHEIIELPDHNIMALGVEMQDIDYEENGTTVTRHVVGDMLVEWTRDGELVHIHSAFDFLDPQFIKEDFDTPFWDQFITVPGGTKDWMHSNGLVYDPSDNSVVMSIRHLDWLVKVARETGERIWIAGESGDFELAPGSEWFYHTHAPQMLDNGHIMLFDNGNLRPGETDETYYSRAVEFSFDETTMVATQHWEYRGDEPFYSQYVSDADRLENGNVLIADGGRVKDQTVPLLNPANTRWSRLLEVTDAGERVWEIELKDFDSGALGYTIYRAQRHASVYPAVMAVEHAPDSEETP